ncbi:MAG: DNA-binding protein [Lentisphaerae bacterium RIFOXYB12_FULL_65_16]|nr:MAG: DNA-binding protein [Lentisphaerae bacterium RIFOXYB12_FULL_65_16]
MKSVYIETSVVSYLAAKPSGDAVIAVRQQSSRRWWQRRRQHFSLFISDVVLEEAAKGDAEAAARRMALLADIPVAELNGAVRNLAKRLLAEGALPPNAADDALHLAVAAANGLDYLLTLNCRHIDNAEKKPLMRTVCMLAGFQCPEICTPDELMGD